MVVHLPWFSYLNNPALVHDNIPGQECSGLPAGRGNIEYGDIQHPLACALSARVSEGAGVRLDSTAVHRTAESWA